MVLKVDLNNLITQPEHDRVFGPHPLFYIDGTGRGLVRIVQVLIRRLLICNL